MQSLGLRQEVDKAEDQELTPQLRNICTLAWVSICTITATSPFLKFVPWNSMWQSAKSLISVGHL